MNIQQTDHEGVTIIEPSGRIDTTTSGKLEDVLRHTVDAGTRRLIVDLAAVEYISSAGLRVFLVIAKRMRDLHGRLILCAMPEPVAQVFRLAGFMALFQVEASRQSAVARMSNAA